MRYVCSVCGYVYDEGKEKRAFSDLPDSWVCPLCGASKSLFAPEKREGEGKKAAPAAAPVRMDGDLEKLPAGVLAALCSNLARGCEKQYKEEEAGLFRELAGYFAAITPEEEQGDLKVLDELFQADLEQGYPAVEETAGKAGDRGTPEGPRLGREGDRHSPFSDAALSERGGGVPGTHGDLGVFGLRFCVCGRGTAGALSCV